MFKNKPEMIKRGICLLSSILFHVLLILLFFFLFPPVRLIEFGQEVRNIVIVPPEKIFAPDLSKGLPDTWEIDEFATRRRPHRKSLPVETRNVSERKAGVEGAGYPPVETSEYSQYSSGFRLDSPLEFSKDRPQRTGLNFPFNLKDNQTLPSSQEKSRRRKEFVRFIQQDFSSYPGIKKTSGEGRQSLRRKYYDLTPWAEHVVNVINKNWLIPATQPIGGKELVKVAVTVRKDGSISSVEIITPSEEESINQAVLKSVQQSSPFPGLPDDFPQEMLEFYLVFQVNE